MSMRQLTVLAKVKAREGMEDEVKQELLSLVSLTRLESGCISYDLHQSKQDSSLYMFYENWASEEYLKKHFSMSYLKNFMGK